MENPPRNRWICDGCLEEQPPSAIATSRIEKRIGNLDGQMLVENIMAHYCQRCWRRGDKRPHRVQGKEV